MVVGMVIITRRGCAPIVIGACALSVLVITTAVVEMGEWIRIGYNAVTATASESANQSADAVSAHHQRTARVLIVQLQFVKLTI